MPNASITAWLNQPEKNYDTGVLLYGQFGNSSLLKSFFATGKGAYHLTRLTECLEKLNIDLKENSAPVKMAIAPLPVTRPPAAAAQNTSAAPRSPQQATQTKILSLTDTEWEKAPDEIKDIYTLNSQLKSHAELLHHQIRIASSAEQRLEMALQLLDDRDRRNENWKIIKDFHATGKVMEKIIRESEKTIDEHTMVELTAIIKNYPTYLSKDRAKLAALPHGSKKNKVLNRIHEREVQLEMAKKRLENVRVV